MRHSITALALTLSAAFAAHAAPPAPLPIPGGFSARLAPLAKASAQGQLPAELAKTLDKSREETHRLIDELVDSPDFEAWRKAMEETDDTGFAKELAGKPKDQIRAALHSRIDRKLAELGKQITTGLASANSGDVQKSFQLALKDLQGEDAAALGLAQAVGTLEAKGAPAAPLSAGEFPPQAPFDAVYGYGGIRAYNAYQQGAYPQNWGAYERTLQVAQQRAVYQQRLAAVQWNARVNSFNQYLYGSSQPWYSNPRYRNVSRCGFPGGMYYQPDRVERIVRRGLWGAAAVAATPFALVASLF